MAVLNSPCPPCLSGEFFVFVHHGDTESTETQQIILRAISCYSVDRLVAGYDESDRGENLRCTS